VAVTAVLPLAIVLAWAIGAAVRRRVVVLVAAVIWPLYFAGLRANLWGYGVGDGWAAVAAMLTIVSASAALAGVITGRAITTRRRTR
jgi:hypothetical protein